TAPIGESIPEPKIRMCVGGIKNCQPSSVSNTQIWKEIALNNPTPINGQVLRPGSPLVTAIGQCNEKTLNCSYRINIGIKLTAKPWQNGITYDTYSYRLGPRIRPFGKIGPKEKTRYNYRMKH